MDIHDREWILEWVAPDGEIVGTFALRRTANPFAIEWLPEWM